MRKSCFDGAVGIEQGKISQHDDIVALLSCALGQNGHSADYVAFMHTLISSASAVSITRRCTSMVVMDLTWTSNTPLM